MRRQSLGSFADLAHVTTTGDRRFRIDIGINRVIQPQIPSGFHYRIVSQTPWSYEVAFGDTLGTALVLYMTHGRLEVAAMVEGPGLPFGFVDIPVDGARCEGDIDPLCRLGARQRGGRARDGVGHRARRTGAGGAPVLLGRRDVGAGCASGRRPDVCRLPGRGPRILEYPGPVRARGART